MDRPYLNNKTKKQYKKLSRFDEDSKFVTERGPKIPELDEDEILKPLPRDVYVNNEVPLDPDDLLTMKIMEMVNAARETRQYIEQTNDHLGRQTKRVDELKYLGKTFEDQVKNLKSRNKNEK